ALQGSRLPVSATWPRHWRRRRAASSPFIPAFTQKHFRRRMIPALQPLAQSCRQLVEAGLVRAKHLGEDCPMLGLGRTPVTGRALFQAGDDLFIDIANVQAGHVDLPDRKVLSYC